MNTIKRFLADRSGATAIEYGLIAGLISIAVLVGATAIGTTIETMFLGPVATALTPGP